MNNEYFLFFATRAQVIFNSGCKSTKKIAHMQIYVRFFLLNVKL